MSTEKAIGWMVAGTANGGESVQENSSAINQKQDPNSIGAKLDSILSEVKNSNTSLDSCIELFDDAIKLTNEAIKQIDETRLFEIDEASKNIDVSGGNSEQNPS